METRIKHCSLLRRLGEEAQYKNALQSKADEQELKRFYRKWGYFGVCQGKKLFFLARSARKFSQHSAKPDR